MKLPRNARRAKAHPKNAKAHFKNPQPTDRKDAGRIGMLKRKLNFIQEGVLAATRSGDFITKGRLDTEAADLQATIFRAESLVAR